MDLLREHLTYRWIVGTTWNGPATLFHPLNVLAAWKPILVFSKGAWVKRRRWVDKSRVDSKEKDWHKHQEPLAEVEWMVDHFSEPGELVVDTCGGGFTTAVACRNLQRRCITCDVDKTAVDKGRLRLLSGNV